MKSKNTRASQIDPMPGVRFTEYLSIRNGVPTTIEHEIVEEALACISINGNEIANFMCSPLDLDKLALGFLYNEGIVDTIEDIETLHISRGHCVDIWINKEFDPPERLIVTAGCGGGVTFDDLSTRHDPIQSEITTTPEKLSQLMKQVHLGSQLYQRSGGIHTAALSDGHQLLMQVEDMGRHNCIDKLAGAVLQNKLDTTDNIMFCSGRISSEMINKVRRMEIPIVCSRTSPTSLSVDLAKEWNITLVGYLHQNRMRIYSAPDRIQLENRNTN
ncbi:MAG: formate dehydrogenase accessory sulfurtransferase FdhD [Anaerolineae bacterium]|nr:formate dehydrogenase accessory sulfurtransferase FdhD [Anaerolineae bacterium]